MTTISAIALWTVATLVGVVLTYLLSAAADLTLPFFFGCEVSAWPGTERCLWIARITLFPSLFLGGCALGILQLAALAMFPIRRSSWWTPATGLGYALPIWIEALRPGTPWQYVDLPPAYLLLGLSIGIAQWLVFRGKLPRAGLWVPANAGSVVLAAIFSSTFQAWLIFPLVFAAGTGTALALLSRAAHDHPPSALGA